ncbi:MAG: lactate racemase domain-containing protein [Caldilineaceae bacterium]
MTTTSIHTNDHKRKQYTIPWNGDQRTLTIPRANVSAELGMTDFPPLADPWQAIVDAMESPLGCAPLAEQIRPRSKVVLLTGDRFTDEMLGRWHGFGFHFLDYLNRLGVRDEDVTLVYAPGSHPSPAWRERLGADLLQRVRAIRHDCFDEASMSYLGVTSRCTPVWINREVAEADFRLGFGEISPNVHGGWCGGGKIILPGVAAWETIEQNHFGVIHPTNTVGLADGNHMRRDMEEGARMAGLDFKVDLLVDSKARIVDVYAGDFVTEHRTAIESKARDIWMTKMAPADIYVLHPGAGFDQYLSSSFFIRMEGAELGTKEDGIIILVLSAAGGWAAPGRGSQPGDMDGEQTCDFFQSGTEAMARAMVRREVNVRTASILYTARRVLERRKVFLVCDGIAPQMAADLGFAYCSDNFDDALATAFADRGPDAQVAVNLVASTNENPPGRPVAWRVMPWREG